MKFTIDKIYLIGLFVMLITFLMNIWTLSYKWDYLYISEQISQIAGILMVLLWTYFFYYLYKSSKPVEFKTVSLKSDNEILKLMQGG